MKYKLDPTPPIFNLPAVIIYRCPPPPVGTLLTKLLRTIEFHLAILSPQAERLSHQSSSM